MERLIRSLFCFEGRVTRGQYLRVGLLLMLLKYAVDALAYFYVIGELWNPIDYLNPIYSERMSAAGALRGMPPLFLMFLLLWGLLFAWIGTMWSARRSYDAGASPWWSLLFFIPLVNYLMILVLVLCPSSQVVLPREKEGERTIGMVLLAGLGLLALCGVVYTILINGMHDYSSGTFLALPVFYGAGMGFLMNQDEPRSAQSTVWFSIVSTFIACSALLLFAVEGMICIAMAFPIVFLGVLLGAITGRALAGVGRPGPTAPMCFVLLLPLATWLESELTPTPERAVVTVIEIDAPPEVVWENVVSFSELPEPDSWLFDTGIAYPVRARIEGQGVGAVRYCEFSTGAFVEPITVWDAPQRLAFDVIEQPIPMEEWSFYDDLRPPHLTTAFRSVRGQFQLTALEGGRTRLEGTTWYKLEMGPELYWQVWSDGIVHSIHRRVLKHVKHLSEE